MKRFFITLLFVTLLAFIACGDDDGCDGEKKKEKKKRGAGREFITQPVRVR